jgi:transcriptional regulator GlxA family with amidase domain
MAEKWTLDALADEVHLSRSQLIRAFDATVEISPMAYLRQMRVKRMARLLVSTDLSVGEAARSVGWRNQFHASQCFPCPLWRFTHRIPSSADIIAA